VCVYIRNIARAEGRILEGVSDQLRQHIAVRV
jgi:hypothetical protein